MTKTLLSLRVLQDPGLSALHLPWRRSVLGRIGTLDTELLMALVARRRTLPDFLTPPPTCFAPTFAEQLAVVRQASPRPGRHDLLTAHMLPGRFPRLCATPLRPITHPSSDFARSSASFCGNSGRRPSSRSGRRCGCFSKPT